MNELLRKQLELAIKWDRLDIANEQIFLQEAYPVRYTTVVPTQVGKNAR